MQAYFPGYPQPVVHALLDLYKQVLAHIEVHSQVGVRERRSTFGCVSFACVFDWTALLVPRSRMPSFMQTD